jgi:hypothetical protein
MRHRNLHSPSLTDEINPARRALYQQTEKNQNFIQIFIIIIKVPVFQALNFYLIIFIIFNLCYFSKNFTLAINVHNHRCKFAPCLLMARRGRWFSVISLIEPF